MRPIIVSSLLMLLALAARAEEAPGLEIAPDGGFAPRGSAFRVAFHLAEMNPVPPPAQAAPRVLAGPGQLSPANEWSSAQGATARLELCLVKRQRILGEELLAAARVRFTNPSARPFTATLAVSLAPGGAVYALAFERHAFFIEGQPVLVADTPSRGAILADAPFAPRPLTPQDQAHVESVKGECRGEMLFDLTLAPGQTQTLGFICPLQSANGSDLGLDFYRTLSVEELFTEAAKQAAPR